MESEHDEFLVLIGSDGEVYPFMDVFSEDDEVDDHIVEAIQAFLQKSGRQLGFVDHGGERDIAVIIEADGHVWSFAEIVTEKNPQEAHLIDAIRAAAKMEGFRLGTATLPFKETECSCGSE